MIFYKFLDKEEWYYFDNKSQIYKLTDKATKEAKESYKEYIRRLKNEKRM